MNFNERQDPSLVWPNGSFIVVETTSEFNDRASAISESVNENFGRESAHLTKDAHSGLYFANVVLAQENEKHYKLDERLALSRTLAYNAIGQIVNNGFHVDLGSPEVVDRSIVTEIANVDYVKIMRQFFGVLARAQDVSQPTLDPIELVKLDLRKSDEELMDINDFMQRRLLIQPVRKSFKSVQLWESSTDKRNPTHIVDSVPLEY